MFSLPASRTAGTHESSTFFFEPHLCVFKQRASTGYNRYKEKKSLKGSKNVSVHARAKCKKGSPPDLSGSICSWCLAAALSRSAAYEFALQMKMLACAPLVFKKVRDDLGGSMFV